MSNPFAAFRKNQKAWMAALVLLAIISFVIYPVFDTAKVAFSGGGGGDNTLIARWRGGKVTLADLQIASQKHSSLVRFLNTLAQQVVEAGGQPRVPGFRYDPQSGEIVGLGIQTSSSEIDICWTRILATRAKNLGISFDDDAVDDFFREFCDGKLGSDKIDETRIASSNGTLGWFDIRELIKQELAAMVVGQIAQAGLGANSPASLYRNFLKLNQTAKVEAFPVFTADYLDKVSGSPSEAEIQAIYDVGVTMTPDPNSPDPGFQRRYQANVEYVEANLKAWSDREKAKLTEEQLRAEYDRRVGLGQLQVPVAEEPESPSEGNAETPATETPTAETPATETPTTETPTTETPTTETPTTETPTTETPATETPTTEAPAKEAPAADTPALEIPAAKDPAVEAPAVPAAETPVEKPPAPQGDSKSEPGAPAGKDQAAQRASSTRLVAFVQDPAAPPPVVQPPQLDDSSAPLVSAPATGDAASAEEKPQLRTQTFEEARDMITDSLARDAAIPALDKALTDLLADVMKPHYGEFRQYRAFTESGIKDENGKTPVPPTKPNIKKLAEDRGLIFNQTGLVDGVQIANTPFGQGNVRADESGISGSVANVVMNPSVDLFLPLRSSYFDQAALMEGKIPEFLQYLLWKTEERQAYIPELSEVRQEVVDAWKNQKARLLASASAIELSKKLGVNSEDPWGSALSAAEKSLVIETDPFTWITRFSDFNRISNVAKLDAVGGEFMQTVFATPVGQVGTAPNGNKNVYYVFRVLEVAPKEDELQQRFNADAMKSGPIGLANEESQQQMRDWYQNLETELGVEWLGNLNQFN